MAPDQALPERYRQANRSCDHCRLDRRRNSTYVVHHDDGRFAQVGSNCLADFLGHQNPEQVAAFLDGLLSLLQVCRASEEYEGGEGGGRSSHSHLTTVLMLSAAAIDQHGWTSKKAARERDLESTADRVQHELASRYCRDHARHEITPTDAHVAEAAAVIEWAQGLGAQNGSLSDYLHNVHVLSRHSVIDLRYLGVAVSMVAARRREQERLVARQPVVSEHVGIVGKREIFCLTALRQTGIEGPYGVTRLYQFSDPQGRILKWFSSREQGLKIGETYRIKATVKAHGEWKGTKETTITRGDIQGALVEAEAERCSP